MQNNKQSALRHAERSTLQPLILLCVIVLMILAQAVLLPGSLTLEQFLIVSRQASALGIITLGQAAVILVGGIDLSVGSMVMITNVFCIAAMQGNDRLGLHGLLLCLLLGLIVGGINAFGVIVLRIAPFVMTLCTTTILQGIRQAIPRLFSINQVKINIRDNLLSQSPWCFLIIIAGFAIFYILAGCKMKLDT